MAGPLFDPEKCDIQDVPSLDFDFVSECSIPVAPPPIFDCPPPIIPLEPAPPCPEFSASVAVDAKYFGCTGDSSNSAAITFTKLDDDPCRFFVDLDLKLRLPRPKIPCPGLSIGSASLQIEYDDIMPTAARGLAVTITKELIRGDCNSDQPDSCKFTTDIDIGIPIPRPKCPLISIGSLSVNTDWAQNITRPSAITVTRNVPAPLPLSRQTSQSPCEYIFDFDLQIPIPVSPCPQITATIDIEPVTATALPTGTLKILHPTTPQDNTTTAPCRYEVSLGLQLPKSCVPSFWCSERFRRDGDPPLDSPTNCSKILVLDPGEEPYATLTFQKTDNPYIEGIGNCDYEIGLDIGIPPAACPVITGTFDVTQEPGRTEPEASMYVSEGSIGPGECKYTLRNTLKLPKSCVPSFWCSERFRRDGDPPGGSPLNCSKIVRIDGAEEAYTHLTFQKADNPYSEGIGECDYEIGLEVGLPVTGITFISHITCVSGEIICTQETIDVVLPPTETPT